jgi:hypothetical protein
MFRRAASICLIASVSACEGGGGGGGAGTDTPVDLSGRHYLPAAIGDRWIYTDSDVASPVMVKVSRAEVVDGQSGVIVHSNDGSGDALLVEDAQGVKQVPSAGSDALTMAIGTCHCCVTRCTWATASRTSTSRSVRWSTSTVTASQTSPV